MMEHIARCTKPPKVGEYTLENKFRDEDFPPSKFFNEETKTQSVRLGDLYQDNAYLYNQSKTCFSIENLSPHNAVNKSVRTSD